LETNVQAPRSTSAIFPFSAFGLRVGLSRFGFVEGPQRCGSTRLPFAPVSLPTSSSV
jgi:hypothetical protein